MSIGTHPDYRRILPFIAYSSWCPCTAVYVIWAHLSYSHIPCIPNAICCRATYYFLSSRFMRLLPIYSRTIHLERTIWKQRTRLKLIDVVLSPIRVQWKWKIQINKLSEAKKRAGERGRERESWRAGERGGGGRDRGRQINENKILGSINNVTCLIYTHSSHRPLYTKLYSIVCVVIGMCVFSFSITNTPYYLNKFSFIWAVVFSTRAYYIRYTQFNLSRWWCCCYLLLLLICFHLVDSFVRFSVVVLFLAAA